MLGVPWFPRGLGRELREMGKMAIAAGLDLGR